MIGDYLYQLTTRDQQLPLISFYRHWGEQQGNQLGLSVVAQVPAEKVLLLLSIEAETIAGATQYCIGGWALYDLIDEVIPTYQIGSFNAGMAYSNFTGTQHFSLLSHPLWLPPGATISAFATFNSSALASNRLGVAFNGILVPRGNIEV